MGMRWPDLFALSEMRSYYGGQRTKSKTWLLASALYASAVLFPAGNADKPSPYSAQFQHAVSFYNLGLTQVLSGTGAKGVATLNGGRYDVPFGAVCSDRSWTTAGGRHLKPRIVAKTCRCCDAISDFAGREARSRLSARVRRCEPSCSERYRAGSGAKSARRIVVGRLQ
jgi:hypothetical protein